MINRTTKYFYDENEKLARMESYRPTRRATSVRMARRASCWRTQLRFPAKGFLPSA